MNIDQALLLAQLRIDTLSGRAQEIRLAFDLTQDEVAATVGVERATISHWERGRRTPRGPAALRYAELLARLSGLAQPSPRPRRARRRAAAPTTSWLDDVARASLAAAQSKFGSQMLTVEPTPAVPAPPTEPTSSSLPDPRTEPTISVKRAGEILGVGRSAAYAAVSQGQIPTIQVGARLVVPTAALLRILEGLPPATE